MNDSFSLLTTVHVASRHLTNVFVVGVMLEEQACNAAIRLFILAEINAVQLELEKIIRYVSVIEQRERQRANDEK